MDSNQRMGGPKFGLVGGTGAGTGRGTMMRMRAGRLEILENGRFDALIRTIDGGRGVGFEKIRIIRCNDVSLWLFEEEC